MEIFKEKGTRWLPPGNVKLEAGIAIAINYLSTGEELVREILKAGDVVINRDEILCKTDCSFSSIATNANIEVSESQYSRLLALSSIKEEKLTADRVILLLKHLITEYSEPEEVEWVPVPLSLNHGQIALLVSSTRVTITRAMSELEERNIIKRKRRQIFFNREIL